MPFGGRMSNEKYTVCPHCKEENDVEKNYFTIFGTGLEAITQECLFCGKKYYIEEEVSRIFTSYKHLCPDCNEPHDGPNEFCIAHYPESLN